MCKHIRPVLVNNVLFNLLCCWSLLLDASSQFLFQFLFDFITTSLILTNEIGEHYNIPGENSDNTPGENTVMHLMRTAS